MNITVEYKTPEKGSVEHKELDPDTEIKFIPDYEILDEEETEELEDYFAKLNNGFSKCQRCGSQTKFTHSDTDGKEESEEAIWTDMDSEIKEIINFNLLTDEQRIKALELAMSGYLAPTKYIHEVTGMSIKCSKLYYDLYIRPTLI